METPENIVEDPDDPEQADGATQMEYFCDYLETPRTGAETKYYLQEPGPTRYC
jgi:hypothetical protein